MRRLLAAFLLFVCLHTGAFAQPLLGPAAAQGEPGSVSATLYFRYRDSAYLAREQRQVQVPRDMSQAQAIVKALVDGPGSLSPYLSPLFPQGTQVLAVTSDGDSLFVTFNAALLNAYADEQPLGPSAAQEAEGKLRRRLAMASLVNTLTESGAVSRVQVLVRNENYISTSMRLSSLYYLEQEESYPDPLVRQEEYIFTPPVTADLFLRAWQEGDFGRVLGLVRGTAQSTSPDQLPAEHELYQLTDTAPKLLQYALGTGTVSLDGSSAVVSVSLRLMKPDGSEWSVYAHPLRLIQREGIYVIPYESLLRLVELGDEN